MNRVTKDLIKEFIKELATEIHIRHSERWIKQVNFKDCDTQRCINYRERIKEIEERLEY